MFSQDAESENKKKGEEKKERKESGMRLEICERVEKKNTQKEESWKKSKRMKFEIEFLGVRPRKLSKLFN